MSVRLYGFLPHQTCPGATRSLLLGQSLRYPNTNVAFRPRRMDGVKVLGYHETGRVLASMRLEQRGFAWPIGARRCDAPVARAVRGSVLGAGLEPGANPAGSQFTFGRVTTEGTARACTSDPEIQPDRRALPALVRATRPSMTAWQSIVRHPPGAEPQLARRRRGSVCRGARASPLVAATSRCSRRRRHRIP